jgi:predicted Zn-dependent protease with MMP-like domain
LQPSRCAPFLADPETRLPHRDTAVNYRRRVSSRRETLYNTFETDPRSDPLAWRRTKAPSLAELEVMAGEIFGHLPRRFRDLCADVVIQVDDFPSEEVLNEMGAESDFDLLGLFQGVGLPFRAESAPVQMPNMIWLYRRPILDYWAEHEETLGAIVKHVLVHEIGHHFGLSDGDMEAIETSVE